MPNSNANDIVMAPISGNIFTIASSSAEQIIDLDAEWAEVPSTVVIPKTYRGRFLTIQAETTNLYIAFSSNAANIAITAAVAPVTPPALTGAIMIPAGSERSFLVPGRGNASTRYLHFISTGAGALRMWPSSYKVSD